MKRNVRWISVTVMVILAMLSACNSPSSNSSGADQDVASDYTLTVLNPQGHVVKDKVLAPRLDTLDGKKVAMWLSATPDQFYAGKGAELYFLMEKMLKEKYPDIQIVSFTDLPMKFMPENEVVEAIAATQPDAVVAGFGG